ncbi:MAG: universal stress protein [Candidatus Methylomirabilis sp.]|nr:universal stress protein [Candidatus Methylomirabilis sp.]
MTHDDTEVSEGTGYHRFFTSWKRRDPPCVCRHRGERGTVILCHVMEVHGPPNPLYAHYASWGSLSGLERTELRQSLLRSLETLVPEQARAEGVTTEVRVVETQLLVHEAICEEAAELDVDLIVMASHGHSGIARLLMGSVAERVLRSADRPVLIVRHRDERF